MLNLKYHSLQAFGNYLSSFTVSKKTSIGRKRGRVVEAIPIHDPKDDFLSEEKGEASEKDASMSLDNANLSSPWITLPARHPSYRFSYKKTTPNGLCFYYSLHDHGIFDPREQNCRISRKKRK
jgi:hypothetical protein